MLFRVQNGGEFCQQHRVLQFREMRQHDIIAAAQVDRITALLVSCRLIEKLQRRAVRLHHGSQRRLHRGRHRHAQRGQFSFAYERQIERAFINMQRLQAFQKKCRTILSSRWLNIPGVELVKAVWYAVGGSRSRASHRCFLQMIVSDDCRRRNQHQDDQCGNSRNDPASGCARWRGKGIRRFRE